MKKKIISEKVKIFFSPSGKQAKINKGQNLLTISRELGVDIDSICEAELCVANVKLKCLRARSQN